MRAWEFDEASYDGNIGIMELMQFFKSAPPELVDRVKRLIDQGEKKQVWQIVQRHTGTKLQGAEFDEAVREELKTLPEEKPSNNYKPEWPFVDGYTKEGKQEHKLLDKPTPGIKELADKHGVDTKDIMRELTKGIKVELEHTSDAKVAREIALDHINELPDYYTRLAKVEENFADGKVKGKSRPGRVKRAGASCKGSVSSLRAKAKKYSGERGKMYHWCANMKAGKKK